MLAVQSNDKYLHPILRAARFFRLLSGGVQHVDTATVGPKGFTQTVASANFRWTASISHLNGYIQPISISIFGLITFCLLFFGCCTDSTFCCFYIFVHFDFHGLRIAGDSQTNK